MRHDDYHFKFLILEAIQDDYLDQIKSILDDNQLNILNYLRGSENVLTLSIELGRIEIVKFLLEKGVNPSFLNDDRETALTTAAVGGQTAIARLLVESGADVNLPEQEQMHTPLLLAVMNDHLEIAQLLLDNGAHPDLANLDEMTPLMRTTKSGYNLEMLRLLLEKGADVNVTTTSGISALIVTPDGRLSEPMVSEIIIHTALSQKNDGRQWQLMQGHLENPRVQRYLNKEAATLSAAISGEDLSNSVISNFNSRNIGNTIDKTQISPLNLTKDGKTILNSRSCHLKYLANEMTRESAVEKEISQTICQLLCNPIKRDELVKRNDLIDNLITDATSTGIAFDDHEVTNLVETITRIRRGIESDQDKQISTLLSTITPQEKYRLSTSILAKDHTQNTVASLQDQSLATIIKSGLEFPSYDITPTDVSKVSKKRGSDEMTQG